MDMGIPMRLALAAALPLAAAQAQDATGLAMEKQIEARYPPPPPTKLLPELMAAATSLAQQSHTCAPTALTIERIGQATSDMMVITAITKMGAHNGWVAIAKPQGCPGAPPLHFIVLEKPDSTLVTGIFGYRDTLVWPKLAKDALMIILPAANARLPANAACATPPLHVDSHVVSRSSDLSLSAYGAIFHGSWRESWTFERCGKRADILVDFVADGNGGANISAQMKAPG